MKRRRRSKEEKNKVKKKYDDDDKVGNKKKSLFLSILSSNRCYFYSSSSSSLSNWKSIRFFLRIKEMKQMSFRFNWNDNQYENAKFSSSINVRVQFIELKPSIVKT